VSLFSGEFDKAMEYYQKGVELFKKTGNRGGIAASYINIGVIKKKKVICQQQSIITNTPLKYIEN